MLLVVCPSYLSAQGLLTGKVSGGGEPLAYAQVLLLDQKQGALTNADGQFQLAVTSYPARVAVRMLGYRSDTLLLREAPSAPLALVLKEQDVQLAEVVIRSDENYGLTLVRKAWERLSDSATTPAPLRTALYRMFSVDQEQCIEIQELFLRSRAAAHRNELRRTVTGRFGRRADDDMVGAGTTFSGGYKLAYLPYFRHGVDQKDQFKLPVSPSGLEAYEFKYEGQLQQDQLRLGVVRFSRKPKTKGAGYGSGKLYIEESTGNLYSLDATLEDVISWSLFVRGKEARADVRMRFQPDGQGSTYVNQVECDMNFRYVAISGGGKARIHTVYFVLPSLPADLQQHVDALPDEKVALKAPATPKSRQERRAQRDNPNAVRTVDQALVANAGYNPAFWKLANQTILLTEQQRSYLQEFEQKGLFNTSRTGTN